MSQPINIDYIESVQIARCNGCTRAYQLISCGYSCEEKNCKGTVQKHLYNNSIFNKRRVYKNGKYFTQYCNETDISSSYSIADWIKTNFRQNFLWKVEKYTKETSSTQVVPTTETKMTSIYDRMRDIEDTFKKNCGFFEKVPSHLSNNILQKAEQNLKDVELFALLPESQESNFIYAHKDSLNLQIKKMRILSKIHDLLQNLDVVETWESLYNDFKDLPTLIDTTFLDQDKVNVELEKVKDLNKDEATTDENAERIENEIETKSECSFEHVDKIDKFEIQL